MNDLVGIIRREDEMQEALARLEQLKARAARAKVSGTRRYNPGWHVALDLRSMLIASECVARAALERQESRGGHTRDDYPAWTRVAPVQPDLPLQRPGRGQVERQPLPPMPTELLSLFERSELDKYMTEGELTALPFEEPEMGYTARFRVWRGDSGEGGLQDYEVEVNEGEVVLDIIHRIQATQAPDLAVRWNCKAGKCGSCSAEINGRPRLLCMTRMSTMAPEDAVS
jgi:ferredoxin